jgi:hypothetical protein
MATVLPIANKVVTAQPQGAYYTVSIDCTGFLDTETNNGGRISPCVAEDFATQPTTLAQSRLVSRGVLRFKKMLDILQVRSNLNLVNIVTTYSSDAGDTAISTLAFGIVYDTDDFVPNVGTAVDGSTTTTTKVGYIKDKITEALMGTFTENMPVYNPTTGASDITIESITAAPVLTTSVDEVLEAVTVSEVTAYRPNTSSELASEGAGLADTAE